MATPVPGTTGAGNAWGLTVLAGVSTLPRCAYSCSQEATSTAAAPLRAQALGSRCMLLVTCPALKITLSGGACFSNCATYTVAWAQMALHAGLCAQNYGCRIRDIQEGGILAALQQLPSVSSCSSILQMLKTSWKVHLEGATQQYTLSSAATEVHVRAAHLTTFSRGTSTLMVFTIAMASLRLPRRASNLKTQFAG